MRRRFHHRGGVVGALLAALLASSLLAPPVAAQSAGPAAAPGSAASISATAGPRGPVTTFVQRAGTRFVVAARGANGTSSADSCEAFNFAVRGAA